MQKKHKSIVTEDHPGSLFSPEWMETVQVSGKNTVLEGAWIHPKHLQEKRLSANLTSLVAVLKKTH